MGAALAVVLLHIAIAWGHPALFWGDNGRWLHELDRVAHGAALYRDIYWSFPPLAMWLLGGATRVIGSDLSQVWTLTSLLAVGIALTYGAVVARLVPGRLAITLAATGMLLGAAYSQQFSAPLALGMYTPAAPVAFFCLVGQLLLFLRDWERPSSVRALSVGAAGGLGVLAKHDVWIPCLVLAIAAATLTAPGREGRAPRLVAALGGLMVTCMAGAAILVAQLDLGALLDIFAGFGQLDEYAGVYLPNVSQLTVEVFTLGLAIAVAAMVAWAGGAVRARRVRVAIAAGLVLAAAATALWCWKAETVARDVLTHGQPALRTPFHAALRPIRPTPEARLRKAFAALRLQALRHVIPTLATLALLALLAASRSRIANANRWRLLIVLLIVCLSLRARRMIAFTEWSTLMLEIPVYVASLALLWPSLRRPGVRALQLGCAILALFALRMHWEDGYGVASRRGIGVAIDTPRGRIRMPPGLVSDLAYVRDLGLAIDPSGTRPIFAFGYSGALAYFLNRPSVDPLSQGFRFSVLPTPDSAYRIAARVKPRLILVDNVAYGEPVQAARFAPWRWMPEMAVNAYERVDRPLFDALRDGCDVVTLPRRRSAIFTVYDCASATRHSGAGS